MLKKKLSSVLVYQLTLVFKSLCSIEDLGVIVPIVMVKEVA